MPSNFIVNTGSKAQWSTQALQLRRHKLEFWACELLALYLTNDLILLDFQFPHL